MTVWFVQKEEGGRLCSAFGFVLRLGFSWPHIGCRTFGNLCPLEAKSYTFHGRTTPCAIWLHDLIDVFFLRMHADATVCSCQSVVHLD